jgi:hypothetical protein
MLEAVSLALAIVFGQVGIANVILRCVAKQARNLASPSPALREVTLFYNR